ncbi:unnamed protein product [Dibothriocephalus latus]|uniref:Fibronectin type-III domain-containing protein n=1 Tax=Dibothriocephalus latus TaxID=60516 RepID=A0A3P7LLM6_DIBLA|nr:unnamed protein product [Dibothriocephalus latus]
MANISFPFWFVGVPAAGDFTAEAINSTSIRVIWRKPSKEYKDEYLLTIYDHGSTTNYTLRETDTIISDLDVFSIYNLTLRAFWADGTPVSAVAATTIDNLFPDELLVRDFTAWAMSSTTIRVRWQKPIRSAEFRTQYILVVSNATHEERFDVEETEKTFTGLNPSTIYSFTVQAIWKNGKSVRWHAFASAKTLPAGFQFKYFLPVVGQQRSYELENTEETVNSLAPATIYNFTVQAIWKSGLPVRTAAFASTRTLPAGL